MESIIASSGVSPGAGEGIAVENNNFTTFQLIDCSATQSSSMAVALFALITMGLAFLTMVGWSRTTHSKDADGLKMLTSIALPTSRPERLLRAFSLRENFSELFAEQSNNSICCLFGLRVIAMCWCLVGHSFTLVLRCISNYTELHRELTDSVVLYAWITNFSLCVDVFFTLAGCLCSYNFLRRRNTHEKIFSLRFWLVHYYWHRVIRLWPALAFHILAVTALVSLMPSRPIWSAIDPTRVCWTHGWQPLLFLNAFIDNGCASWTWYLSAEFVLYATSPPFLLLLLRWRVVGYAALTVAIATACAANTWVIAAYRFPPTTLLWAWPAPAGVFSSDSAMRQHLEHYAKPWYRAGPYFVGMALGVVLADIAGSNQSGAKVNEIPASSSSRRGYHALAAITAAWSLLGLYPAAQAWDWPIYYALYGAIFRTAFSMALAGLIYVCQANSTLLLNQLLSHRVFVPLSTLSYAVYLFHLLPIVLTYTWGLHPTIYRGIWRVLAVCVVQLAASYIYALISYLLIERPTQRLATRQRALSIPLRRGCDAKTEKRE